ncbi:adenylosuccinate lyase [Pseudomonas indica]|uniref:adenylosuccinate lyase n=1 Tax=Pseudomonas indica TaxID=137658 RepID=UPI003FD5DA42
MAVSVFDMLALQHLWTTEELRSIFSEENRVQKWLDFEVALAKTQAELGILPKDSADVIASKARIELIDLNRMAMDIRQMKHSLVPFLKQLQAQIGESGEWLHYGVTTQDVIDTGLVLQLKEAHALYLRDLRAVGNVLARLAEEHRDTVMAGRTHGVHALPVTFGHKCAIWLDEVARHHERLCECERRVFVGMLVGAVGTQAALGPKAREVETRTLEMLGLAAPAISWAPARDRLAEYANLLSMLAATLSKIGNEIFNLQRNECAEVEEGFTAHKIGSSTMPHKRNPALAENLTGLSRAVRYNAAMMNEAMVQEHERDGVAWKTEWKALPECCLIVGAMLAQTEQLLSSLVVNKANMQRNLDIMQGYLLSERVMLDIGERVGKQTAHEWVYEASMAGIAGGLGFADALQQHPALRDWLSEEHIIRLTTPSEYLGETGASIDRTVALHRESGWLD